MSLRADMIGPRRLAPAKINNQVVSWMTRERLPLREIAGPITRRGATNGVIPGCHEPPTPQPALVIREDLVSKSAGSLAKAIAAHVNALAKAGGDTPEPFGSTQAGRSGPRPAGSKLSDITTTSKIPDVSTPQHEHARLTAKKQYLEEKLDAHSRAMHPANHPEVAHRTKVLGQVNRNLQHLESQGVKSTPQHHYDWMQHYATMHLRDPQKVSSMHPEELNTAFSAHVGALQSGAAKAETKASPKVVAKIKETVRRHITGTQPGASGLAVHPGLPSKQYAKLGGSQDDYPTKITAAGKPKERTESLRFAKPSEHPESLKSLAILADLIEKGVKSDKWISDKIRLLMHEGKKQDQAIAIAYSMAGRSKKDKAKKAMSDDSSPFKHVGGTLDEIPRSLPPTYGGHIEKKPEGTPEHLKNLEDRFSYHGHRQSFSMGPEKRRHESSMQNIAEEYKKHTGKILQFGPGPKSTKAKKSLGKSFGLYVTR